MIRDGMGDYMPSWKGILSDNEIADVAAYVRMLAR
jgi:mono/diheme cytochrome c family protein